MKRAVLVLISVILVFISLSYFYLLKTKFSVKKPDQRNIPNEHIQLFDGDTLTLAKMKFTNKLLLVIYSDECDFCVEIKKELCDSEKMIEVSIVMLSERKPQNPPCTGKKNVFWGTLKNEDINRLSGGHVPCVLVYNKNGHLERKIFGIASIGAIKKFIN